MPEDHTDPPADDDKTQIAQPTPAADDKTEIAPSIEDRTRVVTTPPAQPDPVSVPPAAPMPDAAPLPADNPPVPVPIGTLINNNYEIKELINAGGMGEVFRGENVFTGDAVAIKIVLQSLAHDEKVAALFMREAKVLCQLSDQSIVRYYNFVRDADLDRFCLIMEFIKGISLSDHIRDVAPLTLVQAAGLMRRVAAGLDRAHQMDVIHRDLSPDNVMLRDGSVDDAVLIDFGIAKSAEMAESTLHGQLAGKFKYISPEQLGHFGGHIGPRTDIYGLGLLMAAALRGQPLDMGTSIVQAVNARREIPDLGDIDHALRPLLAHTLEPDPEHRPESMLDVIAMLDNPNKIPSKYGQAQPIASGPLIAPPLVDVPGLRQPPGRPQTAGGFGGGPVDNASATPFGRTTGLEHAAPLPDPAPENGGSVLRWLLVLLLFAGIGAFVAWQQGVFGAQVQVATPVTVPDDGALEQGFDPNTREGFLAAWSDDACVFATRLRAGPNSGRIAAFSSNEGAFEGMREEYDNLFDARPAVLERLVSQEQCPALALANAIRTPAADPPVLILDTDTMRPGGTIVGRISNRSGRPVWVAWVSTKGGVHSLNDRLVEQADGSATFSFGLNPETGGEATPQLVMVLATDGPLIASAKGGVWSKFTAQRIKEIICQLAVLRVQCRRAGRSGQRDQRLVGVTRITIASHRYVEPGCTASEGQVVTHILHDPVIVDQ